MKGRMMTHIVKKLTVYPAFIQTPYYEVNVKVKLKTTATVNVRLIWLNGIKSLSTDSKMCLPARVEAAMAAD